jgi:putative tryptophan/tyrosine transport system substrate-binding protein
MRRRDFIKGLGAAAPILLPRVVRAQRQLPVIGYLAGARAEGSVAAGAFVEGLREAGFIDGQNVRIEYRSADGRYDRLPALAAAAGGGITIPETNSVGHR